MSLAPPAHRVTTAHLQAVYPFVAEGGLGGRGAYVGRDLYGGAFVFDPWELYRSNGATFTNPNMLVVGLVGLCKSSLVKTILWRQHVFGRKAYVADPKGEYGPLCAAHGVEPLRVGPGVGVRINPLDPGPGALGLPPDEVARRQLELLEALATSSLERRLAPGESRALAAALRRVRGTGQAAVPTLPQVVEALLEPAPADAARLHLERGELARIGREVAHDLLGLCEGSLRGIFDGPTEVDIDWDGPLVVLDLSAVYTSPALGQLITCAGAWLQSAIARPGAAQRFVVIEEAWALLRNVTTARWLQASFKLCRQFGVCNIAVVHHLSDLRAAGPEGSEQSRLAEGLLGDTGTQVIYGQSPGDVEAGRKLLGLTDTEAEMLPQLAKGVALWKVAGRSFLVHHQVADDEVALVDTDGRMLRR